MFDHSGPQRATPPETLVTRGGTAGTQAQQPLTSDEGSATKSERSLWIWPVILIIGMAVVGQIAGPLGVLAAGVSLAGAPLLFTGARSRSFPRRWLVPVYLSVCLLIIGAIVAAESGVLGNRPVGASTSILLRGNLSPGADVAGIKLDGENLRDKDLRGITAPGASMEKTILEDAKLAGADLRGANLRGARLDDADLRGVNFAGADLTDAVLTDTCLRGANFTGAVMKDVNANGAAVENTVVTPEQTGTTKDWPNSAQNVPGACTP